MPERRNGLGRATGVPGVRPCRLLRLLARQARDKALPRDGASRDALHHAGSCVDVVLRPRGGRAPRAGCLGFLTGLCVPVAPFSLLFNDASVEGIFSFSRYPVPPVTQREGVWQSLEARFSPSTSVCRARLNTTVV